MIENICKEIYVKLKSRKCKAKKYLITLRYNVCEFNLAFFSFSFYDKYKSLIKQNCFFLFLINFNYSLKYNSHNIMP